MIKNFIFDLGNVIIKWDSKYIISKYTDDPTTQELLLQKIFMSPYWLAYDEGTITRAELIKTIQQSVPLFHYDTVSDIIHNWHKYTPVIEGIPPLIEELKEKGYKIYLLSNTNIHFDEYMNTIPILSLFDGFFISAKVKLMKPDPRIYLKFLDRFLLQAEECFFIDDNPDNIEGAKNIGMQGYCFDGNILALQQQIDIIVK